MSATPMAISLDSFNQTHNNGRGMTQRNELVRRELLDLAAADHRLRERLAADGSLYEGYHPEMETLHRCHAARLAIVLDETG